MDYLELNRESWNQRTEVHVESEFYDNESFIQGRSSLQTIELDLLGDIQGQKALHLQCHFGQDTISLARLGATATGMDLSDKAIAQARSLATKTQTPVRFIQSDLYSLPEHLDETFDLVFTTYGVIGWLPDINRWAEVIARYLKPGGRLVFVEFHPVVWMFDDDFQKIAYRYFQSEPIVEQAEGTYTDRDAEISGTSVSWNHGMAEVITSLLKAGLQIEGLQEYDYSPYDCFAHTNEFAPGKFRIAHLEDKIPMVYSVVATKPH